jgi:hypothetical protein
MQHVRKSSFNFGVKSVVEVVEEEDVSYSKSVSMVMTTAPVVLEVATVVGEIAVVEQPTPQSEAVVAPPLPAFDEDEDKENEENKPPTPMLTRRVSSAREARQAFLQDDNFAMPQPERNFSLKRRDHFNYGGASTLVPTTTPKAVTDLWDSPVVQAVQAKKEVEEVFKEMSVQERQPVEEQEEEQEAEEEQVEAVEEVEVEVVDVKEEQEEVDVWEVEASRFRSTSSVERCLLSLFPSKLRCLSLSIQTYLHLSYWLSL